MAHLDETLGSLTIKDVIIALDELAGELLFGSPRTISAIIAEEAGLTVPEVHAGMFELLKQGARTKKSQKVLKAATKRFIVAARVGGKNKIPGLATATAKIKGFLRRRLE